MCGTRIQQGDETPHYRSRREISLLLFLRSTIDEKKVDKKRKDTGEKRCQEKRNAHEHDKNDVSVLIVAIQRAQIVDQFNNRNDENNDWHRHVIDPDVHFQEA